MQLFGQKSKSESDEVVKAEAALKKAHRDRDLAKEEQKYSELKVKESQIRADLEEAIRSGKATGILEKTLREASDARWIQEKKLETLRSGKDQVAEQRRLEREMRLRQLCEKLAVELTPQVEKRWAEFMDFCKRWFAIYWVFERNNPLVRIPGQSRKPIRIRHPNQNSGTGGLMEDICELRSLQPYLDRGWEVFPPDQDLNREANPAEDRFAKTAQVPEVIERILQFSIRFDALSSAYSEEEISILEKELEEEALSHGNYISRSDETADEKSPRAGI